MRQIIYSDTNKSQIVSFVLPFFFVWFIVFVAIETRTHMVEKQFKEPFLDFNNLILLTKKQTRSVDRYEKKTK